MASFYQILRWAMSRLASLDMEWPQSKFEPATWGWHSLNYNWYYKQALLFDLIWAPSKSMVVYFVQLNWVTSWNLKMSILFCFGFHRCWEQDSNAWQYFLRKMLNKVSAKSLIFGKSGTEMGKACRKSWTKQETSCIAKTLSCNRWTKFVTRDEFSVRVTKLLQGLVSYEFTAYLSVFNLFLTQWIMVILSKLCKPDYFEPHDSVKLR